MKIKSNKQILGLMLILLPLQSIFSEEVSQAICMPRVGAFDKQLSVACSDEGGAAHDFEQRFVREDNLTSKSGYTTDLEISNRYTDRPNCDSTSDKQTTVAGTELSVTSTASVTKNSGLSVTCSTTVGGSIERSISKHDGESITRTVRIDTKTITIPGCRYQSGRFYRQFLKKSATVTSIYRATVTIKNKPALKKCTHVGDKKTASGSYVSSGYFIDLLQSDEKEDEPTNTKCEGQN